MGLVTLNFDLLILKLIHASKVGNLPSKLGMLGLQVLELFPMYATDGQTNEQTD